MFELNETQRRIMDTIRNNDAFSRAEVCEATGLTRGAVSSNVKELIELGLVGEQERRQGQRGQPAVPLMINPTGGISAGIALPYGRIDLVAIDYAGNQLATFSAPFEGRDMNLLKRLTAELIEQFLSSGIIQTHRFIGCGVAIAGLLTPEKNSSIQLPETMRWLDVGQYTNWIYERFNALIYIENIVNAAAISEYFHTDNGTISNMVAINSGYGVGCGLIISKQIYRGHLGAAGEIGGLFPNEDMRPSARDLLITLRAAGNEIKDIDAIANAVEKSDKVAASWTEKALQKLFPLVQTISLLLSPEEIVITGMLPKTIAEDLANGLENALLNNALSVSVPVPKIRSGSLGTYASAAGAAWLPILDEASLGNNRPILVDRC